MRRVENKMVELPVDVYVCDVCGDASEPWDEENPPKGWIEIKLTHIDPRGVRQGIIRDVCGKTEPSCAGRALIAIGHSLRRGDEFV